MQIRKVVTSTIFSILLAIIFISSVSTSTAFNNQPEMNSLVARNLEVWSSPRSDEAIFDFVDMSSDGRYVVMANDGGARLINTTGDIIWDFTFHGARWACISDDGKYVAFGGDYINETTMEFRGFVFFFDREGQVWNKTDFVDTVITGSISESGERLAVGYGNHAEVYDKAGVFKWGHNVDPVWDVSSVSISSQGDYVAVGYPDGIFLLYEGYLAWEDHPDAVYPVRISADGKYIIGIARFTKNVLYYNQTGTLLWNQTIKLYEAEPPISRVQDHLAISSNGGYAVAINCTPPGVGEEREGSICFFGNTGLQWSYGVYALSSVDISSDGNFIVAAADERVLHFNKYGKLIWEISYTEDMDMVAISGNGEYFAAIEDGWIGKYTYFSKKYFNYQFVTPDEEPISDLDVRWYFANGTLRTSQSTNATGWIEFFDPYFLDYDVEAYYWQTKVGSYHLVETDPLLGWVYESENTHVASLFDWDIHIHDAGGDPIQARVETYLWNDTLYDDHTTYHLRFENMPNQAYTVKVYYPGLPVVERVVTLIQDEQATTITLNVLDYHVKCVNYYNEPVSNVDVYLYFTNGTLHKQDVTNTAGFADFINILSDSYRVIAQYKGVIVANITDTVTMQDQTKVVELFLIGDAEPPEIHSPSHEPEEPLWTDTVKVSVNVTDDVSGVYDVILSYRTNEELSWTNKTMTYNSTTLLYEASIPPQLIDTNMTYMITAHDNAGKHALNDNQGQYFIYTVIPEFPSFLILPLLMIATLIATILIKKKKQKP